jgi:hypothetical protein
MGRRPGNDPQFVQVVRKLRLLQRVHPAAYKHLRRSIGLYLENVAAREARAQAWLRRQLEGLGKGSA